MANVPSIRPLETIYFARSRTSRNNSGGSKVGDPSRACYPLNICGELALDIIVAIDVDLDRIRESHSTI